jgi:hypothetical protein
MDFAQHGQRRIYEVSQRIDSARFLHRPENIWPLDHQLIDAILQEVGLYRKAERPPTAARGKFAPGTIFTVQSDSRELIL